MSFNQDLERLRIKHNIQLGTIIQIVLIIAIALYLLFRAVQPDFFPILKYEIGENGVTIIGYAGRIENLKIPDKIKGVDVVAIGERAFRFSRLKSVTIPDTVTSIGNNAFEGSSLLSGVIIGSGLTSIGKKAFIDCTALEVIDIPANVQYIGESAFAQCRLLQNFNVAEENTAYMDIDGVLFNKEATVLIQYPGFMKGHYVIPEGVKEIGVRAFSHSDRLTNVMIPDSVLTIGDFAFFGCMVLESLRIPANVTSIGYKAFGTDMNSFWGGLRHITVDEENTVFRDIEGVLFDKDVTTLIRFPIGKAGDYIIPEGVITIAEGAFEYTTFLRSVIIPDSVVTIGAGAFRRSHSLASVTIGEGVTTISEAAFFACGALRSIHIPQSVTYIGDSALFRAISQFSVADGNAAFTVVDGILFDKDMTILLRVPFGMSGEYIIPDGVVYIGNDAFGGSNLTGVVIPDSVITIGRSAFQNCNRLTNVTFGSGVTTIGEWAFSGCRALQIINIPVNVTVIGNFAFARSGLHRVELPEHIPLNYTVFVQSERLWTWEVAEESRQRVLRNIHE